MTTNVVNWIPAEITHEILQFRGARYAGMTKGKMTQVDTLYQLDPGLRRDDDKNKAG